MSLKETSRIVPEAGGRGPRPPKRTTLARERERQKVVYQRARDLGPRARRRVADRRVLDRQTKMRIETVTAEKRRTPGMHPVAVTVRCARLDTRSTLFPDFQDQSSNSRSLSTVECCLDRPAHSDIFRWLRRARDTGLLSLCVITAVELCLGHPCWCSFFWCWQHQGDTAMSGSNPPGGASAEAAADGGIVERRTIPRIFVSERTLQLPLPVQEAARKECKRWFEWMVWLVLPGRAAWP